MTSNLYELKPTITPSDTIFYGNVEVNITFSYEEYLSERVDIYYTTDNTTPSKDNGQEYTHPFTLGVGNTTVQAVAYVRNESSAVAYKVFMVNPSKATIATPTITPQCYNEDGYIKYNGKVDAIITTQARRRIYYTKDISATVDEAQLYTRGSVITLTPEENTIKAWAEFDGNYSDAAIATYMITTPTISASPEGYAPLIDQRYFSESITVTLSYDSSNVDIYYTLDNTQPTTSSQKYLSPIDIDENTVIRAIGYDRTLNRTVAEYQGVYTYNNDAPSGDVNITLTDILTFADPIAVTLSTYSGDTADIYYTLDGSYPTKDNGTKYTEPIVLLFGNYTLRAVRYEGDEPTSSYQVEYSIPIYQPTISPDSGTFNGYVTVTLTKGNTSDSVLLKYSTGGEYHDYNNPFSLVSGRHLVSAKATYADIETLPVSKVYNVIPDTPTITYTEEINQTSATFKIEKRNPSDTNAKIYYTLVTKEQHDRGSENFGGLPYTGAITIKDAGIFYVSAFSLNVFKSEPTRETRIMIWPNPPTFRLSKINDENFRYLTIAQEKAYGIFFHIVDSNTETESIPYTKPLFFFVKTVNNNQIMVCEYTDSNGDVVRHDMSSRSCTIRAYSEKDRLKSSVVQMDVSI